jgi:hypothetical protein
MASMATSSVKLLALVTILLAVFAHEAVEGKTHYLDWEVSPQSNLTSTCNLQKEVLLLTSILYNREVVKFV